MTTLHPLVINFTLLAIGLPVAAFIAAASYNIATAPYASGTLRLAPWQMELQFDAKPSPHGPPPRVILTHAAKSHHLQTDGQSVRRRSGARHR